MTSILISLFSSVSFLTNSSLLQCQNNQNASEGHREEAEKEALKEQLREREEAAQDLREQLALAKASLKDAEIKYATQVQKSFSIHQCVYLCSTPPPTLV